MGLEAAGTSALVARRVRARPRQDGAVPPDGAQLQPSTTGTRSPRRRSSASPSRLLEPVRLPPETIAGRRAHVRALRRQGLPRRAAAARTSRSARASSPSATPTPTSRRTRATRSARRSRRRRRARRSRSTRAPIFDPNLVDLFHHTVAGRGPEGAPARRTGSQALLVDADPEETTVLELRLIEQGFVVKTARTRRAGAQGPRRGRDRPRRRARSTSGRATASRCSPRRASSRGARTCRGSSTRGGKSARSRRSAFELGVVDFVNKPANADVLVAKLKALLDQRAPARGRRAA